MYVEFACVLCLCINVCVYFGHSSLIADYGRGVATQYECTNGTSSNSVMKMHLLKSLVTQIRVMQHV